MLRYAPAALALILATAAAAQIPREAPGAVEKLAAPSAHWVWVSDLVLERAALLDLDSGRFLGLVNGGYGAIAPLFPRNRPELYLPTTYFSKRTRGERSDWLEIYDLATLSPTAEIAMPARRAIDAVPMAHSALSDDDRFVAVFNWTPRTSLSIVDVVERRFAAEIEIPGCSLVYAAGPRRFFSLCADGTALVVTLDDRGQELKKERTAPFFDPKVDPITEKGVRHGQLWSFASFDGWLYSIDVTAESLAFGEKWSLISADEREDNWRIGGWQHLAVHVPTATLYSLVHRGGPDSHKDPSEEVWVYDLRRRERRTRIELRNPGVTIYGFPLGFGESWPTPFNWMSDWMIATLAPAEVSHVQVTQDDQPRLITASQYSGSLGIYDAKSGDWLGRVQPTGWTTDLVLAPHGGTAR
ncbi:MAG TPA: amine dehydrogenase large subunit [Terriglobales bacterium]|nr:amine dehydrogenase large subunit [Terriglobales bacterium]